MAVALPAGECSSPLIIGVWPSGEAPGLGPGDREFESLHPDQTLTTKYFGFTARVLLDDRAVASNAMGRGFDSLRVPHTPVAQRMRAPGREPGGRRFESCRAYQGLAEIGDSGGL